MGQADSKERSKHLAKKSRLIPTVRWRMALLRGAISSPVASRKPGGRFRRRPSASWKSPVFSSSDPTWRGLKAHGGQMDRAVALARGNRRAEHWIAHEQALAQARSGGLQASRRLSNQAMDR